MNVAYAELQCLSNFSFLRGASHPEELVEQAAALDYHALGIADINSLAGVVRTHVHAKEANLRLIIGARLTPSDAPELLIYPTNRAAYGRLARLITTGRRRTEKGKCQLALSDIAAHSEGQIAIVIPPEKLPEDICDHRFSRRDFANQSRDRKGAVFHHLRDIFPTRCYLAASCIYGPEDRARLHRLHDVARSCRLPLVATNDVHYHLPTRRILQDTLVCIREGCKISQAGYRLFPNAERYLKPPDEMARLFADYPDALARTIEIADRCNFSLDELRYEYPGELAPPGLTPMQYLTNLSWEGAKERFPAGLPDKVRRQIDHELRLIEELQYEAYFLTVYDIVKFARSQGILCQGRGSAANSAVCYCIGVTSVDPDRVDLLFERFVSKERDEPPDIDVDFEHERREEVIQYIYKKYGRDRAGMTAEVITYRPRSAVRDVGKALGLSLDAVDQLAKTCDWWDKQVPTDRLRGLGLNPADRTVQMAIALSREILGFPRHLSQHVGGFVMTRGPLCEMVPIENAAMPDRTVIEWNKDDIDALGLLKVDVLGLGMLTCINRAFKLIEGTEARRHEGTKSNETRSCAVRISENENDNQDFSRSDRLAEGNGPGTTRIPFDKTHAGLREIRPDHADAPCCRLDRIEHSRGIRPAEQTRLPAFSENVAWLSGRVVDSSRISTRASDDGSFPATDRSLDRGRPNSSGTYSQCGAIPKILKSDDTASCLRASVPSCLALHTIPPEDPLVYDMICRADTIGVFQIESRAQMSMLPRLKPREFYDLVIEVAIVRPGPIQGNMVHPYLRRREHAEPVTYPNPAVEEVLRKTLGVPLFQEQVMKLAVVAAGFTPGEADQLRRAMAAWKRQGIIDRFQRKFIEGMLANGYEMDFAERLFEQIRGFGEYGFPESHAASFALLVYVSAWLKRYHPAAFAAALINSQPMGFYAPAQIIRDARAHGVPVLPIDINHSDWDCTLEESDGATERRSDEGLAESAPDIECSALSTQHSSQARQTSPAGNSSLITHHSSLPPTSWGAAGPALRLGMRLIKGLHHAHATRLVEARRAGGAFRSIADLARRAVLSRSTLMRLAHADTFGSLTLTRRAALWQVMKERADILSDAPVSPNSCDASDAPIGTRHDNAGPKAAEASHAQIRTRHKSAAHDTDGASDARLGTRQGNAGADRAEPPHKQELANANNPQSAFRTPQSSPSLFDFTDPAEPSIRLPDMPIAQHVARDYVTTGLSLKKHPLELVRDDLARAGAITAAQLQTTPPGRWVKIAGLVICRQRPDTASGVVFVTLEDETGAANLIVRADIYERYRAAIRHATLLYVEGRVEGKDQVIHVLVHKAADRSDRLPGVPVSSHDFH